MARNVLVFISALYLAVGLSGCSAFDLGSLSAEGSKASAVCTKGGPGGTLGIGPGGIVAGAKVNEDFKGTVVVREDCSMGIESK